MTHARSHGVDEKFAAASEVFLQAVQQEYGDDVAALRESLESPCEPLVPAFIGDAHAPTQAEKEALAAAFWGPSGVASFIAPPSSGSRHALLALCEALSDVIPTAHPVSHPMEHHPEAVSRFGDPDGTLKIYDLPIDPAADKYREQAETNEAFDAHNDGLGYAGVIAASVLWTDRPPLWGGYTHFSNVIRASALLAEADPQAFRSLFLPDAITCLRPRGKGAIRVTSPVLYLGPGGRPRVFLRVASGEYRINWRTGSEALDRARAFCEALVRPFAPGSTFAHLMAPGEGVIIRNQHVVHGRTPFIDRPGEGRVLARKWFVERPEDAPYRHVPGMVLDERFAALLPERFGPEVTVGDWHYDLAADANVRVG